MSHKTILSRIYLFTNVTPIFLNRTHVRTRLAFSKWRQFAIDCSLYTPPPPSPPPMRYNPYFVRVKGVASLTMCVCVYAWRYPTVCCVIFLDVLWYFKSSTLSHVGSCKTLLWTCEAWWLARLTCSVGGMSNYNEDGVRAWRWIHYIVTCQDGLRALLRPYDLSCWHGC